MSSSIGTHHRPCLLPIGSFLRGHSKTYQSQSASAIAALAIVCRWYIKKIHAGELLSTHVRTINLFSENYSASRAGFLPQG
jgi:hypothetical protein